MQIIIRGLDSEENGVRRAKLAEAAAQFFQGITISQMTFIFLQAHEVTEPLSELIVVAPTQESSSRYSLAVLVRTSETECLACLLQAPGRSRPMLRDFVQKGQYIRQPRNVSFGTQPEALGA